LAKQLRLLAHRSAWVRRGGAFPLTGCPLRGRIQFMNVNPEMRFDILKSLMLEDRQELRGIRVSMYKILLLLAGLCYASMVKELRTTLPDRVIDVIIFILVWIVFAWRMVDIKHCRQCLEAREDLIKELDQSVKDPGDFNPFVDARYELRSTNVKRKTRVKDRELWLLPILATVAIGFKFLIIDVRSP
jgi:hypothetical protein